MALCEASFLGVVSAQAHHEVAPLVSDPSEIIQNRLLAVIQGEQSAKGLHFFVQVGGAHHDYGMLTLQVSATGWVILGWRLGDDQALHSVQLPTRDQMRLYQVMLELPFWSANPLRRPKRHDQELNVHIRLADQAAGTWTGVQFWSEDLPEHPTLQAFMQRISRLAQAIGSPDLPPPPWGGVLDPP